MGTSERKAHPLNKRTWVSALAAGTLVAASATAAALSFSALNDAQVQAHDVGTVQPTLNAAVEPAAANLSAPELPPLQQPEVAAAEVEVVDAAGDTWVTTADSSSASTPRSSSAAVVAAPPASSAAPALAPQPVTPPAPTSKSYRDDDDDKRESKSDSKSEREDEHEDEDDD